MISTISTAAKILQALALLAAVLLATRRKGYRPVAIFLAVMVAAGWARWGLAETILANAPRPRVGLSRLAFHAEQALFLLWPAGVAALSARVFMRRSIWPVTLAWVSLVAIHAAAYPAVRDVFLARVYAIETGASVIAGLACGFLWIRKEIAPSVEHGAAMLTTCLTGASLFGGYISDPFSNWYLTNIIWILFYGIMIAIEVNAWIRSSPSPPSRPSESTEPLLH